MTAKAKLRSWWGQLIHGRWVVRRTIWPYRDGWGTYCPRKNMVLDTGLSKERATELCKELNRYNP
jgi:hypothetical protein